MISAVVFAVSMTAVPEHIHETGSAATLASTKKSAANGRMNRPMSRPPNHRAGTGNMYHRRIGAGRFRQTRTGRGQQIRSRWARKPPFPLDMLRCDPAFRRAPM
ncbi:hypothetical protein [Mycobacterium sp. NAZ190054]|uniref:hypothetical protein n=1 Tax=Mycobacterium sp. NAZ190054 TaxID=1747766 RepID=UPI001E2B1356|nr:hypothetical protein [Mycobacterium sp. NAZ190054]